jgi:tetratricopeptide (TPR) repeat protein
VRAALRNPVWHDELGLAQATVASAPNSALAHHLLGVTYWELGREREAIEELGRALTICPDHVDALFNLGTIHMLRQRPEEALVYFRRVIDIEPRHLASWVNSAAIYNERGDFQAALEAADHAVAIRPDAGNAHVMRGYALRGVVRLAEARASFERALRLPNPQPDALLGFAETVLEQGDVPRATVAFERLVQAAPSAQAYRGLVTAYRRSGREADAARVARAARARYPDTSFFP